LTITHLLSIFLDEVDDFMWVAAILAVLGA